MNHVLVGQSYYLRFDPKLWEAMQPYPPLGSLYAAAWLRSNDYTVDFFDAMLAPSEAEWEAALARYTPRFALLFEDNFNYLSKMCLLRMRQAAFTMIAMAQAHGCTVIVCGADATDHAAEYLAHGADFVLLGEGEQTLLELLDGLTGRSDTPLEAITGLAFCSASAVEEIIYTPRRPDIKDLDSLPFPAWDLVDIERYRRAWVDRHGYFSMNMVTTRGCPYHCNWCAKPIWGQRYNVRSPENVVAELQWLTAQYRPDQISFVDDIFGLKPGWLERFAQLTAVQGVHVPFKCLSRVDLLLKGSTIPALHSAGAQMVWVGAESGSQKILDAMEKGTTVEQIRLAARHLREARIKVGFFLQFGYPGETWEDIQATLRMVRECRPDDIGISVSYPLPGTSFYERVKDQLGEQRNWNDSQDLAMLYHGPFSTEFYRQLHAVAHKEHRLKAPHSSWQNGSLIRRSRGLVARVYHAMTLPGARRKLARLARHPHRGIRPIARHLSPEQASRPSPQSDG